ncbi:MAG: excinuclease ABC subunit UvrC [Deltaproteobacteria bacterium]|nr:excinuclease ABC subunit UvrC [Deltaproteobacteria bacterium]
MAKRDAGSRSPLKGKLAVLPAAPGCYLFRDRKGEVVYVGKAKSLRARVRSYFVARPADERYFVPLLHQAAADLETVVTASEKEAAILENELIKRHQPRFNVKLRDDKDFLCLRLDLRQRWPRLQAVRRPVADGARYFGPYPSATSARRTLRLVNKHFQLRTCGDAELASRRRPCLQYQIRRCPAPCVGEVDERRYAEQARAVELFLDGRHDELCAELEERMRRASAALDYELAARYRDGLRAVRAVREEQRVVAVSRRDQDVVGLHREGPLAQAAVMLVRQGRVTDCRSFCLVAGELPDEEILAGLLARQYGDEAALGPGGAGRPDEIVLPRRPDAVQGLADWLTERRGRKVKVLVPRAGGAKRLLDLATENARHGFEQRARAEDEIEARLAELGRKLRLPSAPRVVECCDISHLGGTDAVGAIACLRDGRPDKSRYRSFHVRTTTSGDDYAAMYEVLSRRFRRGRDETQAEGGWELPDLLLVDGGRGQLGTAMAAARDLGLHDLAVAALAKERESAAGETLVDRVYLPGQKNPVSLKPASGALQLLARVRDEAHRFANRGRRQAGKRRRLRSELDDIPGLGPATRGALLRELGSAQAVRAAADEQILAVAGVSARHLRALRRVIPAPQS